MSASPALKIATYADLVALPEHLVGELVDGEVYASPRPASPHAVACSALDGELFGPFQRGRGGPGGWWIIFEPELHFGCQVLVPDLAGWRRERMPEIPDVAAFSLAPDWVCEILSPNTFRLDRMRKMPIYLEQGVRHVWLIEPIARTLEVFRAEEQRWILVAVFGDDAKVRAEPFDAVELELDALWLQQAPR